jgi:hypothetical protein
MQRGTIMMVAGISIIIIIWIFSTVSPHLSDSIKGGFLSIVGWLVFFAGFGIRQLDKKKLPLNDPKRKKRS